MNTVLQPYATADFPTFALTAPTRVRLEGEAVMVTTEGQAPLRLGFEPASGTVFLPGGEGVAARPLLAVAEAVFAHMPHLPALSLGAEVPPPADLIDLGIARRQDAGWWLSAEALWQVPAPWLHRRLGSPYPLDYVMTGGRRHPLRRPKVAGVLYERFIPWLGESISFRQADPDQDAERLNRWMNDPRVAAIWEETGDLDTHRRYIESKLADPHMLPLIGCFGGVPFGWFEVYWAKENRIAPYYDCQDFDRGWHVLVGEDAFRGKARVMAWLPSLMHFIFLDDARTQRIVGEPAASHAQQLNNLERSGFAKIKPFDFPHKRAMLVMLLRERYFADRLWSPEGAMPVLRHAAE